MTDNKNVKPGRLSAPPLCASCFPSASPSFEGNGRVEGSKTYKKRALFRRPFFFYSAKFHVSSVFFTKWFGSTSLYSPLSKPVISYRFIRESAWI